MNIADDLNVGRAVIYDAYLNKNEKKKELIEGIEKFFKDNEEENVDLLENRLKNLVVRICNEEEEIQKAVAYLYRKHKKAGDSVGNKEDKNDICYVLNKILEGKFLSQIKKDEHHLEKHGPLPDLEHPPFKVILNREDELVEIEPENEDENPKVEVVQEEEKKHQIEQEAEAQPAQKPQVEIDQEELKPKLDPEAKNELKEDKKAIDVPQPKTQQELEDEANAKALGMDLDEYVAMKLEMEDEEAVFGEFLGKKQAPVQQHHDDEKVAKALGMTLEDYRKMMIGDQKIDLPKLAPFPEEKLEFEPQVQFQPLPKKHPQHYFIDDEQELKFVLDMTQEEQYEEDLQRKLKESEAEYKAELKKKKEMGPIASIFKCLTLPFRLIAKCFNHLFRVKNEEKMKV